MSKQIKILNSKTIYISITEILHGFITLFSQSTEQDVKCPSQCKLPDNK